MATLAPALLGAGHLLFAGGDPSPPGPGTVRRMVTTVLVSAVPEPPS